MTDPCTDCIVTFAWFCCDSQSWPHVRVTWGAWQHTYVRHHPRRIKSQCPVFVVSGRRLTSVYYTRSPIRLQVQPGWSQSHPWFSKRGSRINCIITWWERGWNAYSWVQPRLTESETIEGGPVLWDLTSLLGDSDVCQSWRTTNLTRNSPLWRTLESPENLKKKILMPGLHPQRFWLGWFWDVV